VHIPQQERDIEGAEEEACPDVLAQRPHHVHPLGQLGSQGYHNAVRHQLQRITMLRGVEVVIGFLWPNDNSMEREVVLAANNVLFHHRFLGQTLERIKKQLVVVHLSEVLHYLHVGTTELGHHKLRFVEDKRVGDVKTIWRADHSTGQVRVKQHFMADYGLACSWPHFIWLSYY